MIHLGIPAIPGAKALAWMPYFDAHVTGDTRVH